MATRLHTEGAARHVVSPLAREIIESGVVAGGIGGAAMALFAAVYEAIFGVGFWAPFEAITATVFRTSTLQVSVASVVVGLALHFAVSMGIGVLFSLTVPRDVAPLPALAFGEFTGVAALVISSLVVVPFVNPSTRAELMWGSRPSAVPVYIAFVMHLLYGAGLSLAPALRRRFQLV